MQFRPPQEFVMNMKLQAIFFQRFTKNNFYVEKNPTIVNFPVRNIDVTEMITEEARRSNPKPVYDLVANIVHEGTPESGVYRCQVKHTVSSVFATFGNNCSYQHHFLNSSI